MKSLLFVTFLWSAPALAADCAEFLQRHPIYRKLPARLSGDEDLQKLLSDAPGLADRPIAVVVRETRDQRLIVRRWRQDLERRKLPYLIIGKTSRTNIGVAAAWPTRADLVHHDAWKLRGLPDLVPPGTTIICQSLDDDDLNPFDVYMIAASLRERFAAAAKIRVVYFTHYLDFDADLVMADEIGDSARVVRPRGRF